MVNELFVFVNKPWFRYWLLIVQLCVCRWIWIRRSFGGEWTNLFGQEKFLFETRMMIQHVLFVPNSLREAPNKNLHPFLTLDIPEVTHILATRKPGRSLTWLHGYPSHSCHHWQNQAHPAGGLIESDPALSFATWNLTLHCRLQHRIWLSNAALQHRSWLCIVVQSLESDSALSNQESV
jgi:hypothetical protein